MVKDEVHLASDAGVAHVPLAFGCQTLETNLFYSQVHTSPATSRDLARPRATSRDPTPRLAGG